MEQPRLSSTSACGLVLCAQEIAALEHLRVQPSDNLLLPGRDLPLHVPAALRVRKLEPDRYVLHVGSSAQTQRGPSKSSSPRREYAEPPHRVESDLRGSGVARNREVVEVLADVLVPVDLASERAAVICTPGHLRARGL